VRRRAHGEAHLGATVDLDGLGSLLERGAPTVHQVRVPERRPFHEHVTHVRAEGGQPPGEVAVVAHEHPGNAGEADARDVVRTVGAHLTAVQPGLVPGRRGRRGHVGIDGEQG